MAFKVSPGVSVTEKDFTSVIPAVSTTVAAGVTRANWGPEEQRVLVANETELVNLYGKPDTTSFENWLNIANYLGYGGSCIVSRATTATSMNSAFGGTGTHIKNSEIYDAGFSAGGGIYPTGDSKFYAKYPGDLGNSLRVAVVEGLEGVSNGTRADVAGDNDGNMLFMHLTAGATTVIATTGGAGGQTGAVAGDYIYIGSETTPYTVTAATHNPGGAATGSIFTIDPALRVTNATGGAGYWEHRYKQFVSRPFTSSNLADVGGTGDQFSILVIDEDGKFTGNKHEVVEVYNGVSKAKDARDGDGNSNFYVDVVNKNSKYVVVGGSLIDTVGGGSGANSSINNGAGGGSTFATATKVYYSGVSGAYKTTTTDNEYLNSYNLFSDADTVDVSLILSGAASASLAGSIVDIAEARKDCVAFVSPEKDDTVGETTLSTQVSNVKNFRNTQLNRNSSYAVCDSCWKYQYDRHNDQLRWVPLNGDVAGLCARTDNVNDPWFSPAGYNRGQIRGVVKLSMNPTPVAHRDSLYIDSINPIVSFPGEGTVLFGDKTLQSKGSAFDRINVRRLFIIMEKAISTAAKFQLFEQNDAFTRAQFKNMIEPFLRDIQGRRGLTDFKVVCDETNNTSGVIDANKFVADIFVKPTQSINFIQLNFVAARSGVDFSEIAGG